MTTTAVKTWPDARGRFGAYGGRYVPETLVAPLEELERAYAAARADASFTRELDELLRTFAGRPTPLQFAGRLSEHLGGPRIYIKREDLLHTGAHKINNCLGQALLAERMGKRRMIAETGAGQHGVATAAVAARFGMECVVYMGTEDMERQRLNVSRMRLLGAEVVGVNSGSRTLKDAINEAMRDWVTNVRTTHYLLGSVLGAHPYPTMVRDFHKVIGEEARRQILESEGRLPDLLVACVGGGSNAIGLFYAFLGDAGVRMLGVEAGGRGHTLGEHAVRLAAAMGFSGAKPGVLQGTYTYVLQTRRRADRHDAFGFRGPGLSRGRPGARAAGRAASRRIYGGKRRRGDRRRANAGAPRGHHSRARKRARAGRADRARAAHASRRSRHLQSFRTRR